MSSEESADIGDGSVACGEFGVEADRFAGGADGELIPASVGGIAPTDQRELAIAGTGQGSVEAIHDSQEIRGFAGRGGQERVGAQVVGEDGVVPILGELHRDSCGRAVEFAQHRNETGDARRAKHFQQERHISRLRALVFDFHKKLIIEGRTFA